jgi:hypothetical protein
MAVTLPSDITENGVNQGSLVLFLQNVRDLVNELQADHATNKTIIDELKTDLNAARADLIAIRAAVVAITAKLDLDGGVTDTNYAATCDPAALTVTAVAASSAASLTESTALTLNKG